MTVDVADLLYRTLPGVYRDKDVRAELHSFLQIAAAPLAELTDSVTQLHLDLFIATCRDAFVPLVGALIGADVDPALPARAQRSQVQETIDFYRGKGIGTSLRRYAESLTGWRVTLVDFSGRLARVPFLPATYPVAAFSDRPVTEQPPGSGHFHFRPDLAAQPLFDTLTGRTISRAAFAADPAAYAGVAGRFAVTEVGSGAAKARRPVAADLGDFTRPRTPSGADLTVRPGDAAVDPELSRFVLGDRVLAGNLRVSYHALTPGTVPAQTLSVRDPATLAVLGRSDDPAPYTVDIRTPLRRTDPVGRQHFDNHGFFCTPSRVVVDRRPNALPPGSASGRFTFDDRLLADGDTAGVSLQLLDGIDGAPLTRRALAGREALFCGTRRGFAIRLAGVDVSGPGPQPRPAVVAADLTDFDRPRDVAGNPLILADTDIAVDPELGRLELEPAAFGVTAADVRVDYLLAALGRSANGVAAWLSAAVPGVYAFAADGGPVVVVDALDGTPISMALRLGNPPGRSLADYHGTPRGWTIRRNDQPVALPPVELDLDGPATPVPAGHLAIDLRRGRFAFPAGGVDPGDVVTVDFAARDPADEDRRFDALIRRLPRALPAGAVAVVIDSRRCPVDPAHLA